MAPLFALTVVAAACGSDGDDTSSNTTGGAAEEPVVEADCSPTRDAAVGTETVVYDHDGVERTYELSIPESYDGETAAPVIVNLHGLTSSSEQQNAFTDMPAAAGERGYVVVAPQGEPATIPFPSGDFTATFWNINDLVDTEGVDVEMTDASDDIGFIQAAMDDLENELCLDTDREYVTGMSNGASMAVALACVDGERWSAIAPVGGSNFVTECEPASGTPVVNIHGSADVLAPYEGGGTLGFELGFPSVVDQTTRFAALGGCNEEPALELIGDDVELRTWSGCDEGIDVQLYTVIDGGHTWPGAAAFADIAETELDPDEEAEADAFFGVPLGDILGTPTETIVATDIVLDFFDAHTNA